MTDAIIKYRQVRTFGEIIGAGVFYMRLHFKSIIGSVFTISLPFFALATLISYYFKNSDVSPGKILSFAGKINGENLGETVAIIVIYFIGLGFQSMIISKHFILSEQNNENLKFKVQNIRQGLTDEFRRAFVNVILLAVALLVVGLILSALMSGFFPIHLNAFSGGDYFSFIVQILFAASILLWVFPMIFFIIISSMFVSQRDNIGVFNAMGKVWGYTTNNMLNAWLSSLTSLIIAYVINLMLSLPLSLFFLFPVIFKSSNLFDVMSSINPLVIVTIAITSTFLNLCATSLFQINSIILYGNFEERKEGFNIIEKINNL